MTPAPHEIAVGSWWADTNGNEARIEHLSVGVTVTAHGLVESDETTVEFRIGETYGMLRLSEFLEAFDLLRANH